MNATLTDSWHSYPKVYNLGHAAIRSILDGEIIIEEKVDGSQFSFGKFNGALRVKSHTKEMEVDHPEKMFQAAVDTVKALADMLIDGYTYRAEYLQKPKHNTLAYNRTPKAHLIIFDINDGHESYLPYNAKRNEANRLGLEVVPLISGVLGCKDDLDEMLKNESILGGQLIEGVVIKNYSLFSPDGKAMMGKHVSERFKEIHKHDWKDRNPGQSDVVESIGQSLRTPARWNKAIQHLREDGKLSNTPADIGMLLKEIASDTQTECSDQIKDSLLKWAWPTIQRSIVRGFPEWYKQELAKSQFED